MSTRRSARQSATTAVPLPDAPPASMMNSEVKKSRKRTSQQQRQEADMDDERKDMEDINESVTVEADDDDLMETAAEARQAAEEEMAAADYSRKRKHRTKNAISSTHPRGVKPLGNQLVDNKPSIRASGFGRLAQLYTDAALLEMIRTQLAAEDLINLNRVSKAMYVLSNEEEVWKEQVLSRWEGEFKFKQDWKNTYAFMLRRERYLKQHPDATDDQVPSYSLLPPPLIVEGFYSDEIFQAFYCSHIDLANSFGDDPNGASLDNIPRIHYKELTPERFQREFGVPNRPVIVTGMMETWPCYGKGPNGSTEWNLENWAAKYGEKMFKIGRFTMKLNDYFAYMNQITSDESPLYLFDSKFGEKVPELLEQFEIAPYFQHDFFNLLNAPANATEEEKQEASKVRPNWRWILVGPARSGSTYHKDPNHTSAWNALISGQKKWIMYPPDQTPPGVFPSANAAEVMTPISVAEWFINHYAEHRNRVNEYEEKVKYENERREYVKEKETNGRAPAAGEEPPRKKVKKVEAKFAPTVATGWPSAQSTDPSTFIPGPVEATAQPGEIIFIPNGWWHTALNLTPSFAVTQNYVNAENIWNVCDFLATDEGEQERNLTLLNALEAKLETVHPDIYSMVQEKKIQKEIEKAEEEERQAKKKKALSLWERLTH